MARLTTDLEVCCHLLRCTCTSVSMDGRPHKHARHNAQRGRQDDACHDAQRGRQDAESAMESVVSLRPACAGALPALEGHLSTAMEVLAGLQEAQRSASWSASLLSNLTPQFLQNRGAADSTSSQQQTPSKGVG